MELLVAGSMRLCVYQQRVTSNQQLV